MMTSHATSDYLRILFHAAFLAIYVEMVRNSLLNLNSKEHNYNTFLNPHTIRSSRIGGIACLIAGGIIGCFFIYFLYLDPETLLNDWGVLSHVVIQFLSIPILVISGVAMIQMWTSATSLFLLSISWILGSTLFALLQFGRRSHSIHMEVIGVAITTAMMIVFGILYTSQYSNFSSNSKKGR